LVGATVNFNLFLVGFRGRRVEVRWSLHEADGGSRLAHDWMKDQHVSWLRGKVNKDEASSHFWVPLPKTRGPFFVRVGVYDEDQTELDYADTERFR
jgi:hypothetical protein